jgi:hypothetical protein
MPGRLRAREPERMTEKRRESEQREKATLTLSSD